MRTPPALIDSFLVIIRIGLHTQLAVPQVRLLVSILEALHVAAVAVRILSGWAGVRVVRVNM